MPVVSGDVPGSKRRCHANCFNILKIQKGSGTTALHLWHLLEQEQAAVEESSDPSISNVYL